MIKMTEWQKNWKNEKSLYVFSLPTANGLNKASKKVWVYS